MLTDDEFDFIAEMLRIAAQDLLQLAATLEQKFPTSPLVETLLRAAERAHDVREKIEAR